MSYFIQRKELLAIFLLMIPLFSCSSSIDKAFELFVQYEQKDNLDNEDSMQAIFNACDILFIPTVKEIVLPIRQKLKKNAQEVRALKKKGQSAREAMKNRRALKRFKKHIRDNRHVYNFLGFAQTIERRYHHAFGNMYIVEDVYKKQEQYTYSKKKGDPLMKFYKQLIADLSTINRFEDRLHSRYPKLKGLNYSFKIESIKVRNEILLHPWYKYRLRGGCEILKDAVSPLAYIGVALIHVFPSVLCIVGLTLSTSLGGNGPNQD